jgi:hypothetical protein
MPEFELSEEQFMEVLKLADLYCEEAEKCEQSGAFLAGCIMIGAALAACRRGNLDCRNGCQTA